MASRSVERETWSNVWLVTQFDRNLNAHYLTSKGTHERTVLRVLS
jgi:hypothetical protein